MGSSLGARRSDRGVSPAVAVVIIIGIVVALGAIVLVFAAGLAANSEQEELLVTLETDFDARGDVEPYWVFRVSHTGGDTINGGTLRITFVDDFDGNNSAVTYPGQLSTGTSFRVGLWGDTTLADTGACTVDPEPAPDSSNTQLGGGGEAGSYATEVDVVIIYDPADEVMVEERFQLNLEPNRLTGAQRRHILDGATPSIDCPDESVP